MKCSEFQNFFFILVIYHGQMKFQTDLKLNSLKNPVHTEISIMTKITPPHKLSPKTWYHKHSHDLITFTSPLIRKFCQFGVLGFRDSGSLSGIVAKLKNNHFIDCYVVSFTVIFPSCISYRLDIFALIILFWIKTSAWIQKLLLPCSHMVLVLLQG